MSEALNDEPAIKPALTNPEARRAYHVANFIGTCMVLGGLVFGVDVFLDFIPDTQPLASAYIGTTLTGGGLFLLVANESWTRQEPNDNR